MKKNVCKTHEILSCMFFMDIATNIDIVALVWHVYFNVCDYILENHIGTYFICFAYIVINTQVVQIGTL